ncbi:MAG: PAS domain S-box protein [Nitrospiraceae bacterium]
MKAVRRSLKPISIPLQVIDFHCHALERLDAYVAKRIPEFREEYRVRRNDGSYMWISGRGVAVLDEQGGPIRMTGSDSDITERKREEALQTVEKQALELVAKRNALNDVLAFICQTIETLTSPMLCSVMLVTEDGMHLTAAAAPSLPDEYNRAVDGIPIGPTIGSCGSAAYFRKPTIVSDIATHPLWENYAPVAIASGLHACWSQPIVSATGNLLGTFAAYYRETREPQPSDLKVVERASHIAALAIEHAKMTEALRESESRFQAFMRHSPAVTFIKDAVGRHVYINPKFEGLFGVSREEVTNKTVFDFMSADIATRLHQNDHLVLSSGQTLEIEENVSMPDGTAQHWLVIKFPLDTREGRLLGGVAIDITERKRTEEYLRRTRFAMDQAVDAVYWIDPRARILYTNDAASAMLGYTADEFLRMTVHDLNPNFSAEVWPAFWTETREKKVVSLETIHVTKDGRRIPIDIRVSFLAYEGQEFHCAFVRDITERKRVDEALRESQERFELTAYATNDGIWDWNILTGEQYWSDRHLELFGLEPRAVRPTYETWIALVHPDDADRVHHATCRHLETREPYDIEVRVRMKDGCYRWFRDRGQAVWDRAGRPVRMVGSISDITEQRTAEQALRVAHAELEQRVAERTTQLALMNQSLQEEIAERTKAEETIRESELRYKLLTEATFDGIAIHDQGTLFEVNTGLERMFGYEPGELIGRSLLDLVGDESREQVIANMLDGVRGPYEAVGRRKDGSTFPGEVVVRPYRYRGKDVRLVAGRDLTERKHLEVERARYTEELERQVAQRTAEIATLESRRAQTEKLAAMGRLAAGVAHEINNPIAGIKNAFTLVKQAVDRSHPHYEFVEMIDREISRVSSIVQYMYQLYRPESGKGEVVELRTMIQDIESLFVKQLQQRRLTLSVSADPRLDRLCVPRGDLLQVLLNLLSNAIDCSSEGGTLTLTIHLEQDVVRMAVSDQGPGIAPEHLPHIFDPFFTTKTESEQKGMGLGLSISQSLVLAMGGTLEVDTQLNHGSTFSVLLPGHTALACVQD